MTWGLTRCLCGAVLQQLGGLGFTSFIYLACNLCGDSGGSHWTLLCSLPILCFFDSILFDSLMLCGVPFVPVLFNNFHAQDNRGGWIKWGWIKSSNLHAFWIHAQHGRGDLLNSAKPPFPPNNTHTHKHTIAHVTWIWRLPSRQESTETPERTPERMQESSMQKAEKQVNQNPCTNKKGKKVKKQTSRKKKTI